MHGVIWGCFWCCWVLCSTSGTRAGKHLLENQYKIPILKNEFCCLCTASHRLQGMCIADLAEGVNLSLLHFLSLTTMAHTYNYPRPAVTVDAVVFWLKPQDLQVLLIKRKKDPFKDCWAFPGGFMDMDEPPERAVVRELQEESGLSLTNVVQIGAFGAVHRDPRHRTVSLAYLSILKNNEAGLKAADDAVEARWFSLHDIPLHLAFDHKDILARAKVFADMYFRTAVPHSAEAFGLSETDIQQLLNHIA